MTMLSIIYPNDHLINLPKSIFFGLFNFSVAERILNTFQGILLGMSVTPYFHNYFEVD